MPVLRKSTLNQLKRIQGEINKQGGDTESKRNKKEDKFANAYWIDNPISSHMSGKRHITTYEDFAKIDIPESVKEKNNISPMIKTYDKFNEAKKAEKSEKTIRAELVKYLKNEFPENVDQIEDFFTTFEKTTQKTVKTNSFTNINKDSIKEHFERYLKSHDKKVKKFGESKLNENGPNDTPVEIMANMKTIANWTQYQKLPNPTREMNILQVGKFIDTEKVRGYIMRIENGIAYVSDIDGNTYNDEHLVKVPMKDVIKAYKTKKEKDIKGDVSMIGPSNASLGKAPKEVSGTVGATIDDISKKAADQKIANKIYTTDKIKKLDNSDLTPDFDSSKMNKKASNYEHNAAKDQKITNHNYKTANIKSMTNLANDLDTTGAVKGKHNTISPDLTDKAKQVMNADITKKVYKEKAIKEELKSFEDFVKDTPEEDEISSFDKFIDEKPII